MLVDFLKLVVMELVVMDCLLSSLLLTHDLVPIV